ncbi:MAG: fused MFS/spermidine synthase, partial [Fluviibacter sp.]
LPAIALGYAAGARISERYLTIVARNFLISALLLGIGFSTPFVNALFAHVEPVWFAYTLLIGGILCPLAWLLGQTVPALTNLMQTQRTGEASGLALYWSTLGSFLGSLGLSLFVMLWLGISGAVFLCAVLLLIGILVLDIATPGHRVRKLAIFVISLWLIAVPNLSLLRSAFLETDHALTETAYADYEIVETSTTDGLDARVFRVNSSTASLLADGDPPRYARYIDYLRRTLLQDLQFQDRDILVLGAGGFTLSHREPTNHYTYVDIDPAIRTIAEQQFLREPIRGHFVVDDARHFVSKTARDSATRYDAVVVDVYSSHHNIPSHLVTREFWRDTRAVLKPDGVMLANLILDSRLQSDYARNLLATIESVFGRCAVDVLHKGKPLANVEVACFASSQPSGGKLYVDEKNQADLDRSLAR